MITDMRQVEKGLLQTEVSLAPFTTWKIGGPAEQLYWPFDLEDLQLFLKNTAIQGPLTFLGFGSNVLIPDEGLAGTVIITQNVLKEMQVIEPGLVYAQAGVACAQVAYFAARQGYQGAEFLAGIPGSVGGALRMNAGCYGTETWQKVEFVETLNRQGEVRRRAPSEFQYMYRNVLGLAPEEWFVGAGFRLEAGEPAAILQNIKNLVEKRGQSQPLQEPSCGSVFKNPPGHFVAKLIEGLGLKGHQIGQLQISPKHANFMVNLGGATAQDVRDMIAYVQAQVKAAHGIELQPEVKILT